MVVRQKVGRKRYIAFKVAECGGDLTRSRLAKAIDSKSSEQDSRCKFDVVLVANGMGIVRTDHRNQAPLVALLSSLSMGSDGMRLETLCASGTIRTLKEKYFRQGQP
jgi:RNase P/RNase MRP subunit POP5